MRLFGFHRGREEGGAPHGPGEDDGADGADGLGDLRDRRRARLLEDISSFLLTHRLAVTPFTLQAAHDVVTGANPALSRAVATQVSQRLPVTVDWLEDLSDQLGGDAHDRQVADLLTRLDQAITGFSQTTRIAHDATSSYNSALAAHVDDLSATTGTTGVILELAGLARDMLQRTRDVEQELDRAERETRALQKSLADARREAEVDHLTGLPNRRAFEALLKIEVATTQGNGEALCVAFCDIDHFKRINDTHGHEAGDRILRTVAQTLSAISDDRCHVARHGGEEFVILLRGKRLDEAAAVIDQARETMAARKLINRATDMPFGRISFSAGVADVHAYKSTREALRAADEALYRAKSSGRNAVLSAGPVERVNGGRE